MDSLGSESSTAAVMTTGTRTPFIFVLGSAFVMTAAFLWGAPWKWGQGHRLVKSLRRGLPRRRNWFDPDGRGFPRCTWEQLGVPVGNLGLQGRRIGNSRHEAGTTPSGNLELAFEHERWVVGYGTGVISLGAQYVSKLLDEPTPSVGVESGYGGTGCGKWALWAWSCGSFGSPPCSGPDGGSLSNSVRPCIFLSVFAIWWYGLPAISFLFMHFRPCAVSEFRE